MTLISDEEVLASCGKLTILVVEDNQTILLQYKLFLEPLFEKVLTASNGREGLEIFEKNSIDLILSDHYMPECTGLEMLNSIYSHNSSIPSILATSAEESDILIAAINLNISHFLVKPWNKKSLNTALINALRPTIIQELLERERHNYVTLLEAQKKYADTQQYQGFEKEFQAIRNDYYYHYVVNPNEPQNIWFLDALYKPHDILSGDSYSLRKLSDTQTFLFMVDAMGKGISASITSIISSTFLNLSTDKAIRYGDFDLERIIDDYLAFIKYNLLDDEMVSVLFALFDMEDGSIHYVSFGMPPILLHQQDDSIEKLRANNPPLTAYTKEFNQSKSSFASVKKLLVCSDGLTESRTRDDKLYMQYLQEDFHDAVNQSSLMRRFNKRCETINDDITLLYFYTQTIQEKALIHHTIRSTQKDMELAQETFSNFLQAQDMDTILSTKLQLLFLELLTNAYEHGNLCITADEKRRFVETGCLFEEQQKRERLYWEKTIAMSYGIIDESFILRICDEGEGFDTHYFKQLRFEKQKVHGRGFEMSSKIADTINYSQQGNCVMIHKELKGI